MLKITSEILPDSVRLTLEGRLTGPWADELDHVWRSLAQRGPGSFVVDLTGVTFVGEDGKALLHRMWRGGAALIAHGCCTGYLVGEITGSRPGEPSVRCGTE
jgi:hypothetical protein